MHQIKPAGLDTMNVWTAGLDAMNVWIAGLDTIKCLNSSMGHNDVSGLLDCT